MPRRSMAHLMSLGSQVAGLTSPHGSLPRLIHTSSRNSSSKPKHGFKPGKIAVVTKTTRYEFEQQRYRYAGLSEEDLKHLLAMKGSSYNGLLERHNIHTNNVDHIVKSLHKEGIDVQVVKRGEYDTDVVQWADAIISAGGDGTMLLVASKVLSKDKPVVGVNTDPERSEGHLCLPVKYTRKFPEALGKLCRGEFRWQWRQRIRLHLEGTGINPTPLDLHEEQLSLEQHSQAHRITTMDNQQSRSLNEIFIGESLSSRSYNINKLAEQAVNEILKIGKYQTGLDIPLNRQFIEKVTDEYNESLVFSPEDRRLFFSIREPIVNRVFSSSRQRGFASKVCVRSRCWDACMVVDGGTSFEFNDGAIATISMSEEDQLRTVLLDN
ncbi:NAD kinase 2, mitochondrial isoform X4 [Entelurus aequoreus]|uniref:NAD kinase 2, mitochondrial isoform X4 n=1 Tax=Entelurus aequoreus TaxID=161455 RepID=UPI002B1DF92F|nr:NAD kinase 2, mitochondrial isoform X4 [Entelurus aequoreus]